MDKRHALIFRNADEGPGRGDAADSDHHGDDDIEPAAERLSGRIYVSDMVAEPM